MGYYLDFYGPAIYDFFFIPGQQTAHMLVESVQKYLKPGMEVLDVGTGTGFVAFEVAPLIQSGHVTGIDAEEDALLLARYKASRKEVSNITFQKGDVLNLEFEENTFDMALANQLPVPLPDKLDEMARVVRPGGIVGIANPFPPENMVLWNYDVACELAARHGRKPPDKGDDQFQLLQLPVVQEVFEQKGLEILKLETKNTMGITFETFLLNCITQDRYMHRFVSRALQAEEDDSVFLTVGCLDFLEIGKKLLDEKYGGEIVYGCVIALARKQV